MPHWIFNEVDMRSLIGIYLLFAVFLPIALCDQVESPSLLYTVDGVGERHDGGFGLFGGTVNGSFGTNPFNVGDINGDGVDDLLIGEPGYDGNKGRAIVVFGNTSGLPSLMAHTAGASPYGFSITTVTADSFLGYSVGGGGDYNGDGVNDILVSAYGQSSST